MEKETDNFARGIWYAVELLTIFRSNSECALFIINESGIDKKEFEDILKETDYEVEFLTEEILDKLT